MKSFLYIIKDPLKILISFFFLNDTLLLEWNIENKIKYIYISFCVWKVYKMLTIYLTSRVLHATKMKYQFSLKLKKNWDLLIIMNENCKWK